jgi:RNA polymerase sigma-70 factor, ECF subfamily
MQPTLPVCSKDESQLIQRAQQHDSAAFGEIYHRYAQSIFQYFYYRTGETRIAEDLTAEVFLRALESIEAYQDRGFPLGAWLFRIAHARLIDHWRRMQRHPQVELADDQMETHARVEEPSGDVLADRELLVALRQLTDDQYQVLALRFVQDLDNATIATILGKTEGAVKSLQHRALASLARLLGRQ